MFLNRTDLAVEQAEKVNKKNIGITANERDFDGIKVSSVDISEDGEKNTGKAAGGYITITMDTASEKAEEILKKSLLRLFGENKITEKKILVCGIGNSEITPDSLGSRTNSGILATAHLKPFCETLSNTVYVLTTGVLAQTGIETSLLIKTVVDELKPDYVIAIDALACRERDRLCRTVQLTDTGISPGAGVGNNRTALSHKTLGIPCIAIGVPTVIDYEGDMMVCPRDIDIKIRMFAKLISSAINSVLNPELSRSEIADILSQ